MVILARVKKEKGEYNFKILIALIRGVFDVKFVFRFWHSATESFCVPLYCFVTLNC